MSFSSIKKNLESIYAPLKREVNEFKHTVGGVDYIVVASVVTTVSNFNWWPSKDAFLNKAQPSGTLAGGIKPNDLKDVPVHFWGNTLSEMIGYLKPDLSKNGTAYVRFNKLPMNFPKVNTSGYVMLNLREKGALRVVPYITDYMDLSVMIMTVPGFVKHKAYIAEMQSVVSNICKNLTVVKNRLAKARVALSRMSANNYIRKTLEGYVNNLESVIDNYLASLGKQEGVIVIKKSSQVQVGGIGVIPLIVWGIVAVAGIIGAYKILDNLSARKKEEALSQQLVERSNFIDEKYIENVTDPNRTPEQKAQIEKYLLDQKDVVNAQSDKLQENAIDNKPGILDTVNSLGKTAMLLGLGYLVIKALNKQKN